MQSCECIEEFKHSMLNKPFQIGEVHRVRLNRNYVTLFAPCIPGMRMQYKTFHRHFKLANT